MSTWYRVGYEANGALPAASKATPICTKLTRLFEEVCRGAAISAVRYSRLSCNARSFHPMCRELSPGCENVSHTKPGSRGASVGPHAISKATRNRSTAARASELWPNGRARCARKVMIAKENLTSRLINIQAAQPKSLDSECECWLRGCRAFRSDLLRQCRGEWEGFFFSVGLRKRIRLSRRGRSGARLRSKLICMSTEIELYYADKIFTTCTRRSLKI